MKDFGVIIACCRKDYNFAKSCCASVRHFLGDIPLCLIVDGVFPTHKLEKIYDVQIINRETIKSPDLKAKSFGFGLTKMIAFWEAPWENFLFLDADTIVWGDISKYADFDHYDFIVDCPPGPLTSNTISKFFFDVSQIEKYFPDFNWQIHPYWVTGVFFAKRNVFDLDEYLKMLDFDAKHPGIFKLGEQGILNFMAFRAVQQERIRLKSQKMQVLVRQHSYPQLQNIFHVDQKNILVKSDDFPSVIHWAGAKPYVVNLGLFHEPMNIFRRKFLADAWGVSGFWAELILLYEDFLCYRPRTRFVSKLVKSFLYSI